MDNFLSGDDAKKWIERIFMISSTYIKFAHSVWVKMYDVDVGYKVNIIGRLGMRIYVDNTSIDAQTDDIKVHVDLKNLDNVHMVKMIQCAFIMVSISDDTGTHTLLQIANGINKLCKIFIE